MQTIEQNRHRDYERYEANRRFEEMTDIAERLGYPIDTTIHYESRGGIAFARSDTVERPFHNQTYQAWQRGRQEFTGDQAFEIERLRLEHDEALMVDALGAGSLNGNVLIKLSKVPDAVVNNTTSIKGYRRDLQRSFARIYFRTPDGVSCRLFTLDHNSTRGMEAAGALLGIDANRPSEIVLADHALLSVPEDPEAFVNQLVERTIEVYDQAAYEETGVQSYAGSRYIDRYNAMQVISGQQTLLIEHMAAIASIMGHEELLETQRERTAAAIKLASAGHAVHSTGDTNVSQEVESGNYGRECATSTGMNQTQAATMENVWRRGECQVCFAKTMVGSCMVCASCAAADDQGIDLLQLREQNLRSRRASTVAFRAMEQTEAKQPMVKNISIEARYGQKVRVQRVITIGGQDTLVLNAAGDIIDKF